MSIDPQNPYASPIAINTHPQLADEGFLANLLEIAKAQIFLIQILLVGIVWGILVQVFGNRFGILGLFISVGLQLVVSGLQAFAMFRMGKTVYSTTSAILLAIVSFIPCLGLICMLFVNQAATKKLTEGGIKVGFLGADLKQFNRA